LHLHAYEATAADAHVVIDRLFERIADATLVSRRPL
jgi:hypothetical protein